MYILAIILAVTVGLIVLAGLQAKKAASGLNAIEGRTPHQQVPVVNYNPTTSSTAQMPYPSHSQVPVVHHNPSLQMPSPPAYDTAVPPIPQDDFDKLDTLPRADYSKPAELPYPTKPDYNALDNEGMARSLPYFSGPDSRYGAGSGDFGLSDTTITASTPTQV